ncbi:MAG: hypothetical protein K2I90_07645, partial [Odoribacter sp.]|nr:hypothetical protein [Odoribacter sp.]
VKVQGGSKEYTYDWKFPSSVTATAKDDTLTITAIDYENFGNNQQISVEISDGVKTLSADQAFSVRSIPQITINGVNNGAIVQACKEVDLTLTAAIQGGGDAAFEWNTGAKGSILGPKTSAVGTTTYRVTATYGGCSNTDSVKVQVNELPKVALVAQVDGESVTAVCPGAEITLVGTVEGESSPTFRWMHGASSLSGAQPTIAVNSLTNYGVEYTDATTTCKSEASVRVDVYSKVTLELKNDLDGVWTVCPGSKVTLTVANGDADTYVWSSSLETEDMSDVKGATYLVTPDRRRTYTVKGADEHGCEATQATATLDVRNAPTLDLAQSVLHGCEGGSVDMKSAAKNLSSDYTLRVKNADDELLEGGVTSVTVAGRYTIYIDGGTCVSNEEKVDVQFHELPTATLVASNASVCLGESITLTAGGEGSDLTYTPSQSWSNTPTSVGDASYSVEVKDQYGCKATATASVTVKPLPDVAIVDPGTICAGAEVTLQASEAADSYEWDGGMTKGTEATYKVTPTASNKTFTLRVTKDGCSSRTPASRTLTIQEAPALVVARNLGPCVGESIDLESVFDVPSSWTLDIFNKDKGKINPVITAVQLSDTLFYAKATTSATQGNCASEYVAVRVAIKALPQLTISGLKEICRGDETVLTVEGNAASYAWAPAGKDGANSGATMTVNPTTNTEYTVTATGLNNCKAVAKHSMTINEVPTLTWETNENALIAGDTKVWSISAASGKEPYTYEWTHNGVVDENYTDTEYSLTGVEDVEVLAVKVKDANGCADSLEKSITVTKLDELTIDIETGLAEGEELCLGNVAHLKVITTQGALTSDATYKWSPSEGLDADDVANPVFTATTAGKQTYKVVVTEQGKSFEATVDLPVKNAEAPILDWDPTNPESFVMGEKITMKTIVTKGSPSGNHYVWFKPVFDDKTDLPQYSVNTADKNAYDFAVLMTDANGCRTTDTLTTRISIGGADAIEIKTESEVRKCAVGDVTLSVEKTAGTDQVAYLWERVGNTLVMDDEDTPNVTIRLDGVPAGLYSFSITVTDLNDATNKATSEVLLEIVSAPSVELEEACVALHKDSIVVLNVANPGDYTYFWQESLYGTAWGTPTDKGYGQTVEVRMGDQDMRYILTVRDEESKCEASDTAMIYRIPDAPVVEIDTNTTHLDIKLAWGSGDSNDGYTIWSRKWDPYCLTSADGGVYKEAGNTLGFEWAVPQMDTLEFFYVTADKNVCGQTYYSVTSDTVGYYLFDIQKNTTESGKSSFNFMPIYFDFAEMGCPTTSEIGRRLRNTGVLVTMYTWDYALQTTNQSTYMKSLDRANPAITITQDLGVLKITTNSAGQFLQYGKLPNASFEIKRTNENGIANLNWIYALPQKIQQYELSELFKSDFAGVQILYRWDFESQSTLSVTNFNNRPMGDNRPLRPLMFMQAVLRSDRSYLWK